MTWERWYIVSITALYLAGMLGYEFLVLGHKIDGPTISEMVWSTVRGRPWLSAILCVSFLSTFGLLMGHFFWQASK